MGLDLSVFQIKTIIGGTDKFERNTAELTLFQPTLYKNKPIIYFYLYFQQFIFNKTTLPRASLLTPLVQQR